MDPNKRQRDKKFRTLLENMDYIHKDVRPNSTVCERCGPDGKTAPRVNATDCIRFETPGISHPYVDKTSRRRVYFCKECYLKIVKNGELDRFV